MNAPETMDRTLWRYLHGELPSEERRELERRLAAEPDLAARRDRLTAAWDGLELAPPQPVPMGFETRILARARERSRVTMPAWVRAASAAALAGGLLLGVGFGALPTAPAEGTADEALVTEVDTSADGAETGGLSDDYWRMIEALETGTTASGGLEG